MVLAGKWYGDGCCEADFYIGGEIKNQRQSGGPLLQASDTDHRRVLSFSVAGTAVSATYPLGEMTGAGTILRASCYLIVACIGAATVTVDFLKNGVTILSSVLTLNSTHTARQVVGVSPPGSVTVFADGDTFEATVVATPGGGTVGTGLSGNLFVDENYASS